MRPDIFISYAREDRELARGLAEELEAQGWSVWWDREIAAGERFDQVIARALEGARCVVVLWSEAAIESRWVRDEAAAAFERGALVPALVEEDLAPPLGFRSVHAANLAGWHPGDSDEEYERFLESIDRLITGAAGATSRPVPRRRRRWTLSRRRWSWLSAALGALALAIVLLLTRDNGPDKPVLPPPPPSSPPMTGCVPNESLPLTCENDHEYYSKVVGHAKAVVSDGCPGRVTGTFLLKSNNWVRGVKAYARIHLRDERGNFLQTVTARTWVDGMLIFYNRNVHSVPFDEPINEAKRSEIRDCKVELLEEE